MTTLRLINLTPHVVRVSAGSDSLELPPSGIFARVVEQRTGTTTLTYDGMAIDIVTVSYLPAVEGLPDPIDGVGYVVSRVTAHAVRRPDLYFPLDEIRDEAGHIAGCQRLGRFG